MSKTDNAVGSVSRLGNRISTTIGALNQLPADLGLTGSQVSPVPFQNPERVNQPYWFQALAKATWRKLSFSVMNTKLSAGRRNTVHEYPYRDAVYVEDLGRQARRITVNGFIVGNDVISRKSQFIAAAEAIGDGELFLPTLGTLNVQLINLEFDEFWDKGRVIFLTFTFVQGEQRITPANVENTLSSTSYAVARAKTVASVAYQNKLAAAIKSGSQVVQQAVNTTTLWARNAQRVVNNAKNLYNLAQDIPRDIQRAADDLQAIATRAKPAVARFTTQGAITSLINSAENLSSSTLADVPTATNDLIQSIIDSATTQDDALTALIHMNDFSLPFIPTTAIIGDALNVTQQASVDLFRQSSVIALCETTLNYQPKSYNDALSLRQKIVSLLDVEILTAGDSGQDETYRALRDLRKSLIVDLTARGANLKTIMDFNSNMPLPACLIAYRLYQDVNRTDEVIASSSSVKHPAFMPLSLKVLNK